VEPGGPGDVVGETDELMKNIYAGKPIDWRAIQGARKVIGDSITGATATESSLDNQAGLTDTVSDAAWGTLRETMTGKDAQGNATLAGTAASLFGRLVAGLSTGGKSEAVYTWANMLYAQTMPPCAAPRTWISSKPASIRGSRKRVRRWRAVR